MIRALGALLVVAAAGGIGHAVTENVRMRVALLRETEGFLHFAAGELRLRDTPLPALFAACAHRGGMLSAGLEHAARETARGKTAEDALAPLMGKLSSLCGGETAYAFSQAARAMGRYDSETAASACLRSCEAVGEERKRQETRLREKGRLYGAVSLCLGAMAALAVW